MATNAVAFLFLASLCDSLALYHIHSKVTVIRRREVVNLRGGNFKSSGWEDWDDGQHDTMNGVWGAHFLAEHKWNMEVLAMGKWIYDGFANVDTFDDQYMEMIWDTQAVCFGDGILIVRPGS